MVPIIDRHSVLPPDMEPCVLMIDKPAGPTSFGVVRSVRRAVGVKKVGHAGTLDPMASGLMILLIGRAATRLQDEFMGMDKVYSGTIRLGETTASYDAESPVDESVDPSSVTQRDLIAACARFTGEIEQVPPMYSAIKVGGQRLYKAARRGEEVERKPRRVRIDRFELTARRGQDVDFEVACSKGTYVRSLAHDLGQALGVGGHLTALRRLAIGGFSVQDAFELDEFTRLMEGRAHA